MPVSKNPNVWRNLDEPSSCGYARRCECDCGPHRGIQYEHYQPIFWRVAPSARDNHLGFLAKVLANERTIALVWEEPPGTVEGFIIANIIAAPPVYEPGGPTCMVDDYWVRGVAGVGRPSVRICWTRCVRERATNSERLKSWSCADIRTRPNAPCCTIKA